MGPANDYGSLRRTFQNHAKNDAQLYWYQIRHHLCTCARARNEIFPHKDPQKPGKSLQRHSPVSPPNKTCYILYTFTSISWFSTTGAFLLRMSHGYIINTQGDLLVDLIGTAANQFYMATRPGRWLVDTLPFRM